MIVPQFPNIRIFESDCIEGMRSHVEDNSIDIVVTSPPYNLGIKYSSYKDNKNWDEFLDWCCLWVSEVHRCLRPDGSFFLNVGCSPSSPLFPHMLLHRLCDPALERHFVLQNTIHWVKSIAIKNEAGEEVSKGHIKPINSERFLNDGHEFVFHLTPNGDTKLDRLAVGVPYADKSNISRWGHTGGSDLKCRGNMWFIPYKTIQSRSKERPHPATFPTELATRCIKLHGKNKRAVVMDPFLGIGHSALAAIECGVAEFIGFDIDGEYLRIAEQEIDKIR